MTKNPLHLERKALRIKSKKSQNNMLFKLNLRKSKLSQLLTILKRVKMELRTT
jgi:hypothetical protein